MRKLCVVASVALIFMTMLCGPLYCAEAESLDASGDFHRKRYEDAVKFLYSHHMRRLERVRILKRFIGALPGTECGNECEKMQEGYEAVKWIYNIALGSYRRSFRSFNKELLENLLERKPNPFDDLEPYLIESARVMFPEYFAELPDNENKDIYINFLFSNKMLYSANNLINIVSVEKCEVKCFEITSGLKELKFFFNNILRVHEKVFERLNANEPQGVYIKQFRVLKKR